MSRDRIMVLNATFNNISLISWWSVLSMAETGENHRPPAYHWQTLSHNLVFSPPRVRGIRTHNYNTITTALHHILWGDYHCFKERGDIILKLMHKMCIPVSNTICISLKIVHSFVFCLEFCISLYVILSFCPFLVHCIICPSSIYGFLLPLWYLHFLFYIYYLCHKRSVILLLGFWLLPI